MKEFSPPLLPSIALVPLKSTIPSDLPSFALPHWEQDMNAFLTRVSAKDTIQRGILALEFDHFSSKQLLGRFRSLWNFFGVYLNLLQLITA